MNKKLKIIIPLLIIIIIIFITLPTIEFKTKNKLIAIRYKNDITEFETNECYSESYHYNEKHNISLQGFDYKKILFLHIYSFEYKKGNICETEYLLEESYIKNFLENAKIKYNNENIDIKKLIEGKTPIVSNTRYLGNDYTKSIDYILNGKHETMYIFYKHNLLIIQVGQSDEGPKYIAYK